MCFGFPCCLVCVPPSSHATYARKQLYSMFTLLIRSWDCSICSTITCSRVTAYQRSSVNRVHLRLDMELLFSSPKHCFKPGNHKTQFPIEEGLMVAEAGPSWSPNVLISCTIKRGSGVCGFRGLASVCRSPEACCAHTHTLADAACIFTNSHQNKVWNTPLSLIQSLMHTNSHRLGAPQLQSCVASTWVREVVGASQFINHIWEPGGTLCIYFPYLTSYSTLTWG